jgi:hypothetical protein
MATHDEMERFASDLMDKLVEYAEEHERTHHDGVECRDERCNVVAAVAHRLKLAPDHLAAVAVLMVGYRREEFDRRVRVRADGDGPLKLKRYGGKQGEA